MHALNTVGPLAYMDYDGTRAHVRHCRSKSIAEHIVFRTVSAYVTFMHLLLYFLLLFVLLYAATETKTPDDLSHNSLPAIGR